MYPFCVKSLYEQKITTDTKELVKGNFCERDDILDILQSGHFATEPSNGIR